MSERQAAYYPGRPASESKTEYAPAIPRQRDYETYIQTQVDRATRRSRNLRGFRDWLNPHLRKLVDTKLKGVNVIQENERPQTSDGRGFIITPFHQNAFDVPVIAKVVPERFIPLAGMDSMRGFGNLPNRIFNYANEVVPIERGRSEKSRLSCEIGKRLMVQLAKDGMMMVHFLSGTWEPELGLPSGYYKSGADEAHESDKTLLTLGMDYVLKDEKKGEWDVYTRWGTPFDVREHSDPIAAISQHHQNDLQMQIDMWNEHHTTDFHSEAAQQEYKYNRGLWIRDFPLDPKREAEATLLFRKSPEEAYRMFGVEDSQQ